MDEAARAGLTTELSEFDSSAFVASAAPSGRKQAPALLPDPAACELINAVASLPVTDCVPHREEPPICWRQQGKTGSFAARMSF